MINKEPDNDDAAVVPFTAEEVFRVRGYLEFPLLRMDGFQMRMFSQMGDGLAVIIARLLYPFEQIDDLRLRKTVAALSVAFASTADIVRPQDREPAVTVCLLERLAAHTDCAAQKDLIRSAIQRLLVLLDELTAMR